jgi:hypothetical protein
VMNGIEFLIDTNIVIGLDAVLQKGVVG